MSSLPSLEFGKYYHVFNRGNNYENLFKEQRNYPYFLKLYQKYILPLAETYAYCLLKNHFHLMIRIRTVEEQINFRKDLPGLQNLSGLKLLQPSQQFSNLFNSYTKSINKMYQRPGNLFHRPFQRIEVDSETYFINLIHYIHFNPQKHGFVKDFKTYPYSSYRTMLSDKPTKVQRDAVLQWFSGTNNFTEFHNQLPDEQRIHDVIIDLDCQLIET